MSQTKNITTLRPKCPDVFGKLQDKSIHLFDKKSSLPPRSGSAPTQKPRRNLSERLKPAVMTYFSGYPQFVRRQCPYPQQASFVAAANIPGGDKPYLTAGERSVTRGRQIPPHLVPEGGEQHPREGWRKEAAINYLFPIIHHPLLPTFAPFGDAHTDEASYPRVTLTAFTHPRLSIIGPLRGPSQPKPGKFLRRPTPDGLSSQVTRLPKSGKPARQVR